ncbi:MAG: DNA recombination protein RmuC [Oscillospiraceae bacterium]|jgi:DNA recombination protein RmuC|nr:DNA recombination protein RmuC [Oscillospiraceae bacterium]
MTEYIFLGTIVVLLLLAIVLLIVIIAKNKGGNGDAVQRQLDELRKTLQSSQSELRRELAQTSNDNFATFSKMISDNIGNLTQSQNSLTKMQSDNLEGMNKRLGSFAVENEQKLEQIRKSVETKLNDLQRDNNDRLEKMRETVDEKLQKTLESKISESFKLVNDQLDKVAKGLGEMQNIASGVGDIKKVLSNVKSRGILGEIQLSAILKEILTPEQFEENFKPKKNSQNVVEFAIKLPGSGDGFVYLPIDSKFPGDSYAALRDAYELGEKAAVDAAAAQLVNVIKSEARDIRDKYINPPVTTDFAIMFLPFEGLYAEAVNRGLVETLQRDYKINIAGPSTMAALLNSLQMGFRTLAVQKQSAEVWKVLNEVKKQFDMFGTALEAAQDRIRKAEGDLETLVGVRTREMQKKLNKVQTLPEEIVPKTD